jgi:glycosyltransferase involved in cell wall biosynthesis
VQSFESVLARIPEARLVLVGDGKERHACERLVEQNPKLHEKVFFTGKRADAFQVLRGADVVALSSTKEGMPYVVLEAKFAGTPVVATRVGGIPEMGEGSDLKLVVPHSPEMLSEALVQMLRTEKQTRGHLPWQFTLTGMVDAIEAVYHEIV